MHTLHCTQSHTLWLLVHEQKNQQSLNLPQGAGIQAAQNVANHEPEVVLTGNCGPKAFRTLRLQGLRLLLVLAAQ